MSSCGCGFCHLHVHSEYSLLDGANRLKDLAKKAAAMDMPALALTDHGVMYGAVDHYSACKAEGIKPIIGVEAYVAPRKHTDKDSQLDSQKKTCHLTLWAKNKKGYENLVKLTTKAHLQGYYYKPRVDHELLAQHSEGIICGSACLGGEVPQLIMQKKLDEAAERALMYRDMFGKENYFLELMDHDLTGQAEVNERIVDIHHKTGIPLICSNDAHYLTRKDEEMHKILVCIGTNSTLEAASLHYGPNFYLKSKEEMWERFKHVPSAMDNTLRIADMVDLQLDLKTTHFPEYEVPAGHDKTSYLRELCKQKFDKRYPPGHPRRAEAIPRMEYELEVIIQKGYPGYFLVVQDFINWSKDRGILVGCRGSAAGCLVSYVLGITNLDPLPYGLLFERFLNPDRISMPDIDVDFPDKRRDEVLKYVTDKYGKDKVAQIITFGTLAARASVRDTARVMGMDLKVVDQVAKLIPAVPGQAVSITGAIEQVPDLANLYNTDGQVRRLLDAAKQIEGMTRHASRHACGVVIGSEPLDTLVPLEEKDGVVITQYHAKAVEKIGLVKMDFLGLTSNSVIDDTLHLIQERHGTSIDLENIDLTDKKVYDMLGKGDGVAIFQMEGTGMRNLLRDMKPENLEHIIAQISLYRPGPMEEIPKYIAGRRGGKVTYMHPKLEPILKDTYGMLLYQEQVMRAAQEIAGFTGGQADELRGAMAKKKKDVMDQLRPLFVTGCGKNGIPAKAAEEIFQRMEDFAKYAFNKSHAAYYGLVAYWTGYLKSNYASEFMACNMSSRLGNKDKLLSVIEDCRKREQPIAVLPPDINESNQDFTVVGLEPYSPIRFGLLAIKGVGEGPVKAIMDARREGGRFISLHDFCERVPSRACNRSCTETLIKAGCFDGLHPNRKTLMRYLDDAMSSGLRAQKDSESGQASLDALFSDLPVEAGRPKPNPVLTDEEDASRDERLQWEKDLVGLYVSDHPLNPVRDYLEATCTPIQSIGEDPNLVDGTKVTIGGLVTSVQKRMDKNGRNWAIFQIEDLSGSTEVLCFAKAFEKCGEPIKEDAKLLVTGRLSADTRGGGRTNNSDDEGGGGGEEIRYKLMADEVKEIQMDKAESMSADLASRPKADPAPEPAAPASAVRGHILLGMNGGGSNGNGNGASNGNGHTNVNANGASGHTNGSGMTMNRSVVPPDGGPPIQLPQPTASYSYEEEGPARISYSFAPPMEAEKAIHIHVPSGSATQDVVHKLFNICQKNRGATEVWLHLDNGQEMVQLKISNSFWVDACPEFCDDVARLLGVDCLILPLAA